MLSLLSPNNIERRTITTENISHLLEAIQSLSAQLFVFRTNIEPVTLLKSIPDDLADLLNNSQLNELIDSACLAAKDLNEFIKPFLKMIQSCIENLSGSRLIRMVGTINIHLVRILDTRITIEDC